MKRFLFLLWLASFSNFGLSQKTQYYQGDNGETHLCGPFELRVLENDTSYTWFNSGYEEFDPAPGNKNWVKGLGDVDVEIYLGTWCGDSKNWVPKFVKTWDQLGLNRKQLRFTALYDMVEGASKYKQGPNGEEKGKDIHRVPTFIFKKDGQEIARIVESPVNDLQTDLAQIAFGFPSTPNYRGASYLMDLFKTTEIEDIKANEMEHLYAVYRLIKGNPSELNTLGYVLLESGQIEEALLTLYFNMRYFRYDPNVYDSYAEALARDGQKEKAIEMYEKVLLLDRSNSNAIESIKRLKQN